MFTPIKLLLLQYIYLQCQCGNIHKIVSFWSYNNFYSPWQPKRTCYCYKTNDIVRVTKVNKETDS